MLFHEGDTPSHIYQVASGCIKLTCTSLNGRQLLVHLLYPGDCFDIHSLLDNQSTTYTAASLSRQAAEVYSLAKDRASSNATLLRMLSRQMSANMRQQQGMMTALVGVRVEQRLLLALHFLARRAGQRTGSQWKIPVPLSRQELGEFIATTTETAIRALSDLQQRGLVSWQGRHLVCDAEIFGELASANWQKLHDAPDRGRFGGIGRKPGAS